MMLRYILLLALIAFPVKNIYAQSDMPIELQQFEGFADILPADELGQSRGSERVVRQQEIIPLIKKSIPEMAAYNITNAEQIFCYHVTKRPQKYTGYTLDGMAITGFCGELDTSKAATTYEALFTHNQNILTAAANCRIEPRIMLRFIRGVDYADVLLSSPCPSFTIFYGGKYQAFNIKKGIIDDIISQLEKEHQDFYSPSLLKQTVATAVATTTKEEEMLSKKQKEDEPMMSWKKTPPADSETPKAEENKQPTSGWGIKSWRQK